MRESSPAVGSYLVFIGFEMIINLCMKILGSNVTGALSPGFSHASGSIDVGGDLSLMRRRFRALGLPLLSLQPMWALIWEETPHKCGGGFEH